MTWKTPTILTTATLPLLLLLTCVSNSTAGKGYCEGPTFNLVVTFIVGEENGKSGPGVQSHRLAVLAAPCARDDLASRYSHGTVVAVPSAVNVMQSDQKPIVQYTYNQIGFIVDLAPVVLAGEDQIKISGRVTDSGLIPSAAELPPHHPPTLAKEIIDFAVVAGFGESVRLVERQIPAAGLRYIDMKVDRID